MTSIDWDSIATLQQRDDAGSDMFVEFKHIGDGSLAEMIGRVMQMPPHDRARVVLDAKGLGMLDVGQIVELSRRPDFPQE